MEQPVGWNNKRKGSLTVIALFFLVVMSSLAVFQLQTVNFEIANNELRIQKYRRHKD